MSLGKLIYRYYYAPTLPLRYYISHFGLVGSISMLIDEAKMKKAATTLLPLKLSVDFVLEVNYLTGSKYWHQTIFCAYSLAKKLDNKLKINIYSDGSLAQEHIKKIQKIFSNVNIISFNAVNERLDQILPRNNFPTLRYLRDWHPFFMRLIDIHTSPSWSVHLDSDMLFFDVPKDILDAHKTKKAIYMQDLMENSYYVDTEEVLAAKYDINCAQFVNGGIVGYNNDIVDYHDLESKATKLLKEYPNAGPAQIEQTLMSFILFKQSAVMLDKNKYQILYNGTDKQIDKPAVLHYIFKAKYHYLTQEWKKIIH